MRPTKALRQSVIKAPARNIDSPLQDCSAHKVHHTNAEANYHCADANHQSLDANPQTVMKHVSLLKNLIENQRTQRIVESQASAGMS